MVRRGRTLAVLAVALASLFVPSGARAVVADAPFCESPQPLTGFGTSTQFRTQYEVFIKAFEAKCRKAIGLVSYFAGDDSTTYQRMLIRGPDLNSPDNYWTKDTPLSAAEKTLIEGDTQSLLGRYSPIGHFPLYIDGLAVAYNLSCYRHQLSVSTLALALMYEGQITKWDDPKLAALNPGIDTDCKGKSVKLTARADSSGQTAVFKTLLSRRDPSFVLYSQPQFNTTWPATIICRGGGDRGAAGCVTGNSGSVGYVTISRAQKLRLRTALVERVHEDAGSPGVPSVDYVGPTTTGCTEAAAGLVLPPGFDNWKDWSQITLVDAHEGYPICYFSYMLVMQKQAGGSKGEITHDQAATLRDYMNVIFTDPVQKELAGRGYAALPGSIVSMNKAGVDSIEYPDCSLPGRNPLQKRDGCFSVT